MSVEVYSPVKRDVSMKCFVHRAARICLSSFLVIATSLFLYPASPNSWAYDPLRVSETLRTSWSDFTVHGPVRQRSTPIRVFFTVSIVDGQPGQKGQLIWDLRCYRL
jgi:hypothetical protein